MLGPQGKVNHPLKSNLTFILKARKLLECWIESIAVHK